MENAGIFYGHLKYSTVIWYILWPFGNVVVVWYLSPRFGKLCQEKSGNPVINPFFALVTAELTISGKSKEHAVQREKLTRQCDQMS
jgi:hypothetical protein